MYESRLDLKLLNVILIYLFILHMFFFSYNLCKYLMFSLLVLVKKTLPIQIQLSVFLQTTYDIQFQMMQFYMIGSFCSIVSDVYKTVFLRIRCSKALMNSTSTCMMNKL